MPDSDGCVHGHPTDVKTVADILRSNAVGAVAHKNVGGVVPYPYIPQGLLSIEQVDGCES